MLQRVMEAKRPLRPTVCSIYHTDFWWVERLWKMLPIGLFRLYDGTPFKSWFLRLQGIKVGSMVFDDGVHCTEPSLTTIGDEVVLNTQSCLQCHSQEDGTFKADRSVIGARSTVGVAAHVHYGVTMGEESHLAADSYLMKGEDVPARARWAGNVARQISEG
jgi:non-ribosomal peptide synthetase-like protein